MKNKLFYGCLFALCVVLSGLSLQSFGGKEDHFGVGESAITNYRLDTIVGAAKDTIGVVTRESRTASNLRTAYTNFASLYTYDVSVTRVNISGTTNVRVFLDKSVVRASETPTDWVTIDSTTTTGATTGMLRSLDATGYRYRFRVSGTGTQSTAYRISGIWKKKN